MDAARKELRRRTQTPELVSAGKQRTRLTTRLEPLKKQHAWGDISDDDYRRQRDETHAALAQLPDGDRIVAFDVEASRKAVSRKTAGVPPRGFEPLISTLKGWRPRPLDDGGRRFRV